MGDGNPDPVTCRSEFTYAQRPAALRWEGQCLEIKAVEAEWHTPDGRKFRVCTLDGLRFELSYNESRDEWGIIPL